VTPAAFPHRAHTPLEQRVLGDVQRVPVAVLVPVAVPVEQHALPGPPQLPALQLPLLQVPGIGMQLLPFATQTLEMQQPLSSHELPEQQGCPGPPQAVPVNTTPPAPPPEPPTPVVLMPPPPPETGVLLLPPEPPLPPTPGVDVPPDPPSPLPPVAEGAEPSLELEFLHPATTKKWTETATAEHDRMDSARRCLVMGKLLGRQLR
jgi:hypothetical protein